MATLNEFMSMTNDAMSGVYFGVVELENSKMVGWIEDPIGAGDASDKLRLRFPLEFKETPLANDQKQILGTNVIFIVPEIGLPDEYITDGSVDLTLFGAKTSFGLTYRRALEHYLSPQSKLILEMKPAFINRSLIPRQPTTANVPPR